MVYYPQKGQVMNQQPLPPAMRGPGPMDFDEGGYTDSGTYESGEEEFLHFQINVTDVLDDFEHRVLRGEHMVINPNSGERKWVPYVEGERPLINEKGIRQIMARLLGKVTKIAKLSYKDREQIMKDCFYFHMSLAELIAKKCDEWEMDPEFGKVILDTALEIVWDTEASSLNGFTAINLRSTYSRSDVTRLDAQSKGETKSFLGIPLGRR